VCRIKTDIDWQIIEPCDDIRYLFESATIDDLSRCIFDQDREPIFVYQPDLKTWRHLSISNLVAASRIDSTAVMMPPLLERFWGCPENNQIIRAQPDSRAQSLRETPLWITPA